MYEKSISSEVCYWDGIFDKDDRATLITGWIITGRIAFCMVIWLNLNLWCSALRHDLKYRNLAVFTTVLTMRRGYHYIFYFLQLMDDRININHHRCNFNGFLETFLGVYEVESLTHVCIERYVVAKYLANGWAIKRWHYSLYPCLCFFFSLLYSLSPLFGIGSYARDITCFMCSYNMILQDSWERYVVITIYLLRSVKPFIFMLIMRVWTQQMEAKFNEKNMPWKEVRFAHIVDIITTTSIVCWLPITTIKAVIIIMVNILHVEIKLEHYVTIIQYAIWLERNYSYPWSRFILGYTCSTVTYVYSKGLFPQLTPAVITVTLLYVDRLLRSKMFGGNKSENDVVKVYEKEIIYKKFE